VAIREHRHKCSFTNLLASSVMMINYFRHKLTCFFGIIHLLLFSCGRYFR